MKTKIIIILLVLINGYYAKSQIVIPDPCNCTPISTQETVFKNLCPFVGFDQFNVNVLNNPDALWIQVKFTRVTCGPDTYVQINSILITTSYFNYAADPNISPVPPYTCLDMHPPFNMDPTLTWDQWLNKLLDDMLPSNLGLYPGGRGLVFPVGCMSLVKVQFPSGSTLYESLGDTGGYKSYDIGGAGQQTLMLIPCDAVGCCTAELSNEGGVITKRPIKQIDCEGASIDPLYVPSMSTHDPNTGSDVTYYGTITETVEPCKLMCNLGSVVGWFTTDVSEAKSNRIEFSAYPTLVKDHIKFTTNNKISKVEAFNMAGEKVLIKAGENVSDLETSTLKAGIYFIQVYFDNNIVKTIKIIKQ